MICTLLLVSLKRISFFFLSLIILLNLSLTSFIQIWWQAKSCLASLVVGLDIEVFLSCNCFTHFDINVSFFCQFS